MSTSEGTSEIRGALGRLVRMVDHGNAIAWSPDIAPLVNLREVRERRSAGSDAELIAALFDALRRAVESMGRSQDSVLLTILLGIDAEYRSLSARRRREIAGRRFRGGNDGVSWETIRQHHEPRALDALASVLSDTEFREVRKVDWGDAVGVDLRLRASVLATRLASTQLANGGWPHWLDERNATDSIVSTAQVLEILRLRDGNYHAAAIQSGLHYLATSPKEHMRQRGENTRFAAFALWGLARFRRALADPKYRDGIDFSIRWLRDTELPETDDQPRGGWAVGKWGTALSLTITTPAIDALDRLIIHRRHGELAQALTARARAALTSRTRITDRRAWWPSVVAPDRPSAAETIHAVLALTSGSADDLALARRGAAWLMEHTDEWTTTTEVDRLHRDRHWTIMSPSLGLRAVVHPAIGFDPFDERLRPAIVHLCGMWHQEHQGWGEVPYVDETTTTGAFAVITAFDALKRRREFDPVRDIPGITHSGLPRTAAPSSPYALMLDRTLRHVRLERPGGELVLECTLLGAGQWAVLERMAARHQEHGSDQRGRSTPIEELCRQPGGDVKPASAVKTIRRLNKLLTNAALKHGVPLPDLIEKFGHERRYLLTRVDTVVFVDTPAET